MNTNLSIASCSFPVVSGDTPQQSSFQVLPAGVFKAADGRPVGLQGWMLTPDNAKLLIEKINARKNPLVIDWEHQTINAAKNGQPAPAAGWVKDFEWRDDGLYAINPKWTAKAQEQIKNDEYRYISPVFSYDNQTGAVQQLHTISLTNNPALDGMQGVTAAALSALLLQQKESSMNPDLLKTLNLPDGSDDAAVLDAIKKLQTLAQTQGKPSESTEELTEDLGIDLISILGLPDGSEKQAIIDEIKKLLFDKQSIIENIKTLLAPKDAAPTDSMPAKMPMMSPKGSAQSVPVAAVYELQQHFQTELAALRYEVETDKKRSFIEKHADSFPTAGMTKWASGLNFDQLQDYVKHSNPIAALTKMQTQGITTVSDNKQSVLSETEKRICAKMGITEETYLATRGEE